MVTRRIFLGGLIGSAIAPSVLRAQQVAEPEFLKARLADGSLPPMVDRIPAEPRVINLKDMGRVPGTYGGNVRTIIGSARDIRYMTVYGYSRLIGYDTKLQFQPDILRDFTSEDATVFTFRLREGHKWSDGSDFTSDDFRYVWDDMFHNKKLYKGGVPASLKIGGKPPKFEALDRLTVRYSWDEANPDFMADIASPSPLRLMHPANYLKQFHVSYQTKEKLEELIKQQGVEDWVALHQKMSRTVRPDTCS